MNAERILALLPAFWRSARLPGSPLEATLESMADMLAPVSARLDTIDEILDPRRCPDRMLPWLASMLGFAPLLPLHRDGSGELDDAALRALIMAAPALAADRGTRAALERALGVAVGPGFAIVEANDELGDDREFHFVVLAPARHRDRAPLVEALVRHLKPAHVTHRVHWQEQPEGPDGQ